MAVVEYALEAPHPRAEAAIERMQARIQLAEWRRQEVDLSNCPQDAAADAGKEETETMGDRCESSVRPSARTRGPNSL
jgi:hypothetical protein